MKETTVVSLNVVAETPRATHYMSREKWDPKLVKRPRRDIIDGAQTTTWRQVARSADIG